MCHILRRYVVFHPRDDLLHGGLRGRGVRPLQRAHDFEQLHDQTNLPDQRYAQTSRPIHKMA